MPYVAAGVIPAVLLPFHDDLSFDEQRRVLEISREELRLPIVNGIYADGSLEAARLAKMAAHGGAAALLVFPPAIYTFGQRPEMAVAHFKRIADATSLPLILFQYPLAGGQGYPLSTLTRILDAVPSVRAIKDWCANPQLHDRQIRALQSRPRPVNVLTTHSSWLFSSLLLGKLPRAVVRPPLVKLPAEEIERIRAALVAAGLLNEKSSQRRVA